MNWRERYARYRRYGLDPLPQDASHAEREARIAQLRVLRGKRQRKIALRSGLGTLAIAIGVALLAYWLLMTIGGRDVLLAADTPDSTSSASRPPASSSACRLAWPTRVRNAGLA